jgi:3-deoxy-manno-octulosonate cytidylyltransferase (CMP-KDO synthetase)
MKESIQFAGIIPARYASSRFPGKPLAIIGSKPMIRLVYEQAVKSLDVVCVATDDRRIYDAVTGFGGKVVMTSPDHLSGTDRCAEAAELLNREIDRKADVIINIQGDEPFIRPEQIELLKSCFEDKDADIATLIRKVNSGEDIFNPNQPKVIVDARGFALYFSRAAIPYIRGAEMKEWSSRHVFYKHIGIYAYRSATLKELTRLDASSLEKAESLEQNRWLENGFRIKTAVTQWENIGIDTPEDLEIAKRLLS